MSNVENINDINIDKNINIKDVYFDYDLDKMINYFCAKGDVNGINWILENNPEYDDKPEIIYFLCKYRYFDLVINYMKLFRNYTYNRIMNLLCLDKDIIAVKWLLDYLPRLNIDIDAFYFLSRNRNIYNEEEIEIIKDIFNRIPNAKNSQQMKDIFISFCENGNIKLAKWCHSLNPDKFNRVINYVNLCEKSNLEICKWIFEIKPDLKLRYHYEIKDLFFQNVCINGNLEVCKFYMEKYKNVKIYKSNYFVKEIFKPYNSYHTTKIIKYIYELYPQILNSSYIYLYIYDLFNDDKDTNEQNYDMLKWLLSIKPSLINNITMENLYSSNIEIDKSYSSLCMLNSYMLKYIYDLNPDLNLRIDDDMIFKRACKYGYYEIVKLYNELYPDILTNHNKKDGICKLFIDVCKNGDINIAKIIFEVNPDINLSYMNESPFICACSNGNTILAKWLLLMKPNINTKIKNNKAFYLACKYGHLHTAKWLLSLSDRIVINSNLLKLTLNKKFYNIFRWLYTINPCIDIRENNDKIFRDICMNSFYLDNVTWMIDNNQEIMNNNNMLIDLITDAININNYDFIFYLLRIKNDILDNDNLNYLFIKILSRNIDKYIYDNDLIEYINIFVNCKIKIVFDSVIDKLFKRFCDDKKILIINKIIELNPDRYSVTIDDDHNIIYKITKKYDKKIVNEIDNCIICFSNLSNIITDCNHQYCEDCLNKWLDINNNCAYCRNNINKLYMIMK